VVGASYDGRSLPEGQLVATESDWTQTYDPGLERLRPFTEPMAAALSSPNETHLEEFASVIENVIVPRLLMLHSKSSEKAQARAQLDQGGVRDFIALTMDEKPDAAINFVQQLLDDGVPFQDILLQLMAPAARELGERWTHDSSSFVEVTLGVARMHRILREFDGVPAHMWSNAGAGRHILLMPTPGEQHTFGLRLVQEFLLRESWQVSNHPVEKVGEIAKVVARDHYDVIGLSLSGETLIESIGLAIKKIRSRSLNPLIKVIVGGHIFVERPELLKMLDVDGYAPDAPSAVALVNQWASEMAAVV
jgi:methanogenic corrinoid protein MtbC1